jgi:hypothetical protein
MRIRLTKHLNGRYCSQIGMQYRRHAEGLSWVGIDIHLKVTNQIIHKNNDLADDLLQENKKNLRRLLHSWRAGLAEKALISFLDQEKKITKRWRKFKKSLQYFYREGNLHFPILLILRWFFGKTIYYGAITSVSRVRGVFQSVLGKK